MTFDGAGRHFVWTADDMIVVAWCHHAEPVWHHCWTISRVQTSEIRWRIIIWKIFVFMKSDETVNQWILKKVLFLKMENTLSSFTVSSSIVCTDIASTYRFIHFSLKKWRENFFDGSIDNETRSNERTSATGCSRELYYIDPSTNGKWSEKHLSVPSY